MHEQNEKLRKQIKTKKIKNKNKEIKTVKKTNLELKNIMIKLKISVTSMAELSRRKNPQTQGQFT